MSEECCVYRLFDGSGILLYIGMTKHFAKRLEEHRKKAPWGDAVETFTLEVFASRREAEICERNSILAEGPLHNRMRIPARSLDAPTFKDYLTPEECAELDAVSGEKAEIAERYNSIWKKLKTRCDARMRRDKAKRDDKLEVPE